MNKVDPRCYFTYLLRNAHKLRFASDDDTRSLLPQFINPELL